MPSRDEIFSWPADYQKPTEADHDRTPLPILPNLYRVLFALGAQSDDIFPKGQYR
jgi:hypothetical protein